MELKENPLAMKSGDKIENSGSVRVNAHVRRDIEMFWREFDRRNITFALDATHKKIIEDIFYRLLHNAYRA